MPSLRASILVCEVSFKLHEELAKTLDIKSYRKLPVLSVSPGKRSSGTSDMCEWLDGEVENVRLQEMCRLCPASHPFCCSLPCALCAFPLG